MSQKQKTHFKALQHAAGSLYSLTKSKRSYIFGQNWIKTRIWLFDHVKVLCYREKWFNLQELQNQTKTSTLVVTNFCLNCLLWLKNRFFWFNIIVTKFLYHINKVKCNDNGEKKLLLTAFRLPKESVLSDFIWLWLFFSFLGE